MPTLLHQTRYRPLLPFVPPAALSPGADDEQSLAINPQFADYLGGADDSDQWRGGGRDNTPPVPPVEARESSMPPPGLAQPLAPAAPQQAPGMARRALVGPPPVPQAPAPPEDPQLDEGMAPGAEVPAAAPQDDAEPPAFDYKTRRKELLADLQKNSTPAEKGTHWAQRLGMALLAGTKLGPVANMIVHPKWSEQEHRRQAALASDEDQLKALNTAEGGEALTEQRQATAEQKRREKARDNYITVPGGGLFNTAEKRWERQPADRSQLTPISKEQAEAIGLQPLEDGTYAIPNSAVGSLITSQKDPKGAKTIEEQILRIRDDDDNYPTPELKQGVIDALIKDHNRLHPTAPIHGIETDKSGNATLVVADPSDPTKVTKVPLGAIGKPQQPTTNSFIQSPEGQQALDEVARGLANGDLSRLRDIASLRGDQRLQIYSKAKQYNPNFSTAEIDRKIKMEDYYANGKGANNLQSFGTFLEHGGAAAEAATAMGQGNPKLMNKPINWLRDNVTGDPRLQQFITSLEPVRKEFEGFLLGGRALYGDDRKQAEIILNDNSSLAQTMAALKTMGHTAKARFNEENNRYKKVMGKDLADPFSPEAVEGARKIGLDLGGEQKAPTAGKAVVQHSPSTGAYRYSTDGGKTWRPGQPTQ